MKRAKDNEILPAAQKLADWIDSGILAMYLKKAGKLSGDRLS
jgi:hypothetical protein